MKTRWILGLVSLCLALEVASRILFGNYAQSALVERVEDPNLCMVLGENRDLTYTGWYRKVEETQMQSDGFRSRGFVKSNKNQNVKKLFMLGDSFTYGQGVNIESSLPHLVNEALGERFQVWNFGVPGRNFYQIRADIERVMRYKPDAIFVNLFINDFHEPPGECMLSASTDWQMPLMRKCHLCRWVLLGMSSQRAVLSPTQIEQEVVQNIEAIELLGRQNQVPIVFVLLMDHHVHEQFEPEVPAIYPLVHEHATRWLDLDETWASLLMDKDVYQIEGEYHWNPEGNQILATAYATVLNKHIHNLWNPSK